jgi:hypothetical protein
MPGYESNRVDNLDIYMDCELRSEDGFFRVDLGVLTKTIHREKIG